ncbi:EF-hand domain-containing protein [Duganella sp. CT11-25]|uniref:EF-hand domain-containing protein n=1 Tax=unclassified Duganella TaxID=2636909 RepID=UPI0039B09FEE
MKMFAVLAAVAAMSTAGAQAPQPESATPPAVRSAPAHPEPYVPPSLRRPLRDASSGPILLRYQAMQKLKKRFDDADLDGSGTLSRDEARKAGLGFIDKNFDHIDSAQRGSVNFEDLKAWLIQRREEARSR